MESVFVGIIALIIGGVLFVIFAKGKSRNEVERVNHISSVSQSDDNSRSYQANNRPFTLAELKQAEEGNSWDEAGCVFEINSDGSVTVVGRFDPAELIVDPAQEIFERLNNDGFIEMLPQMWSFHVVNNQGGENDTFVVVWNDVILSVPVCPHTIDDVKSVYLIPSSFEGGISDIILILSKTVAGYLTLMPSNEKEYILSLGAKACVERAFGDKVRVKISTPAVM